jgi:hypothetical protein
MSNALPKFKWFQYYSSQVSGSLAEKSIVFSENAVDNSLRMWTDLIENIPHLNASVTSAFNSGVSSGDTLPSMPEFWPDPNLFRKCVTPEVTSDYFTKFCAGFGLDESEVEEAIFLNLILEQYKSRLQFHKCHWLKVSYGRMAREFTEQLRPNDFYKLDNLECFEGLSELEKDYVWGLVSWDIWSQESELLVTDSFLSNFSFSGILSGKLVLRLGQLSNAFWVDGVNEYSKLKSRFGGEDFLKFCYDTHKRKTKSWKTEALTKDISCETAWVLSILNLGYVPVGSGLEAARASARVMDSRLRESFLIKARETFVRQVFRNAIRFSYILGVFIMLDKKGRKFMDNRRLLFSSYFAHQIMECADYAPGMLQENAGLGLFAVESFWDIFCRKLRLGSSEFNRYQSVNLTFTDVEVSAEVGIQPSF